MWCAVFSYLGLRHRRHRCLNKWCETWNFVRNFFFCFHKVKMVSIPMITVMICTNQNFASLKKYNHRLFQCLHFCSHPNLKFNWSQHLFSKLFDENRSKRAKKMEQTNSGTQKNINDVFSSLQIHFLLEKYCMISNCVQCMRIKWLPCVCDEWFHFHRWNWFTKRFKSTEQFILPMA